MIKCSSLCAVGLTSFNLYSTLPIWGSGGRELKSPSLWLERMRVRTQTVPTAWKKSNLFIILKKVIFYYLCKYFKWYWNINLWHSTIWQTNIQINVHIAKVWKQQTVPAFDGMINRNILWCSKIGKKKGMPYICILDIWLPEALLLQQK